MVTVALIGDVMLGRGVSPWVVNYYQICLDRDGPQTGAYSACMPSLQNP
jgi:hypothetical protein